MNELGLILLGAAARITVLGAVGLVGLVLARRRGPAAAALTCGTTLGVMLMVSALAGSPWPAWWVARETAPTGPAAGSLVGKAGTDPTTAPQAVSGPSNAAPNGDSVPASWAIFAAELVHAGRAPTAPTAQRPGWRWPAWVACAFLAGLAVASTRLAVGIAAVGSIRASGRPIVDRDLLDLVASLREELGLVPPVTLAQTEAMATPATLGWWRPVVLLPPCWPEWTLAERRAILVHELAHIHRRDYLVGLIAQVSLTLHYYHPFAHLLARSFRLQGELAADAWGARLLGGSRPYLITLANLALRQAAPPPAWPVRPFLPTRGTFLRRIEMLRDPRNADQPPTLARGRALATVTTTVAVGLLVAGLRPAGPTGLARDQTPAQDQVVEKINLKVTVEPASPASVIDPRTASPEMRLVLDIRPAALLKFPAFAQLAAQVSTDDFKEYQAIASGKLEQVLVLTNLPPDGNAAAEMAVVLRANQPMHWGDHFSNPGREVREAGITYRRGAREEDPRSRVLDDRTLLIVVGNPRAIFEPPVGAGRPIQPHGWDDTWGRLKPGPIRLAMDTDVLSPRFRQKFVQLPQYAIFAPIFEPAQSYALGLEPDDAGGLRFTGLGIAGTPAQAARVGDTLRALLTLGRNSIPAWKATVVSRLAMGSRAGAQDDPSFPAALDALAGLLAGTSVEQDGAITRIQGRVDSVAPIAALLSMFWVSREAHNRANSVNNLKQIGLAMHNYENDKGSFPPAVVYGPNGKTPHSWRVALLPYLGAEGLYREYKLDEPWDGPHNRTLVARMPEVYRDRSDTAAEPGHSSYFVPTGPKTLFPPRREGMRINEVTDGTSNTIMAFEARRAIPWTQPEDVPIGLDTPLPALGDFHPGGFDALFADGAVRFIMRSTREGQFRNMMTATGGEFVSDVDKR